jgi:hypothetical protein
MNSSKGLMIWLLSVWVSFLLGQRGIATITISATTRNNHIRLFAKRLTCHGYAPTDILKKTG